MPTQLPTCRQSGGSEGLLRRELFRCDQRCLLFWHTRRKHRPAPLGPEGQGGTPCSPLDPLDSLSPIGPGLRPRTPGWGGLFVYHGAGLYRCRLLNYNCIRYKQGTAYLTVPCFIYGRNFLLEHGRRTNLVRPLYPYTPGSGAAAPGGWGLGILKGVRGNIAFPLPLKP